MKVLNLNRNINKVNALIHNNIAFFTFELYLENMRDAELPKNLIFPGQA